MKLLTKFTFLLNASDNETLALAFPLLRTDEQLSHWSLYAPLREMLEVAMGLRHAPPQEPSEHKIITWMGQTREQSSVISEFDLAFRRQFGPSYLGRLSIDTLKSSGELTFFERFLIPDVKHVADIQPFLELNYSLTLIDLGARANEQHEFHILPPWTHNIRYIFRVPPGTESEKLSWLQKKFAAFAE